MNFRGLPRWYIAPEFNPQETLRQEILHKRTFHIRSRMENKINFSSFRVSETEVLSACALAKEWELKCEFQKALEALAIIWRDIESQPDITELSKSTACEVLLRCGKLASYLGSRHQHKNLQEHAKALLTNAFEKSESGLKRAEIESAMAKCYFREGAFDEALTWIDIAIDHAGSKLTYIYIAARIEKGQALHFSGRVEEAKNLFNSFFGNVLNFNDKSLSARFYHCYGTVLKDLGQLRESVSYLKKARQLFEETGNLQFAYGSLNNLANALMQMKRYNEADEEYEKAKAFYIASGNKSIFADVLENQARLYLELKQYDLAESFVTQAIGIFEQGDQYGSLFEALTTRIRIYLAAEKNEEALCDIARAVTISNEHISEESAKTLIKNLVSQIYIRRNLPFYDEVHNFESTMIREAMVEQKGLVIHAARQLRLPSHQSLSYMLENRHSALKIYRKQQPTKPKRKRKPAVRKENEIIQIDYTPESFDEVMFIFPDNFPKCHTWIPYKGDALEYAGVPDTAIILLLTKKITSGDLIVLLAEDEGEIKPFAGNMVESAGIIGLEVDGRIIDKTFAIEDIEILGRVVGYAENKTDSSGAFIVKPI